MHDFFMTYLAPMSNFIMKAKNSGLFRTHGNPVEERWAGVDEIKPETTKSDIRQRVGGSFIPATASRSTVPDDQEQGHPACRNGPPVSYCHRNSECNSQAIDQRVPDTTMLDLCQQTVLSQGLYCLQSIQNRSLWRHPSQPICWLNTEGTKHQTKQQTVRE